jgi:tripartite-type tricarboxylate transporter receptor subunit TctC
MPPGVVARLNGEIARILGTEEMKARAKSEGLDIAGGPPEALGAVIRRDVEKWRRVIKEAKISREG